MGALLAMLHREGRAPGLTATIHHEPRHQAPDVSCVKVGYGCCGKPQIDDIFARYYRRRFAGFILEMRYSWSLKTISDAMRSVRGHLRAGRCRLFTGGRLDGLHGRR